MVQMPWPRTDRAGGDHQGNVEIGGARTSYSIEYRQQLARDACRSSREIGVRLAPPAPAVTPDRRLRRWRKFLFIVDLLQGCFFGSPNASIVALCGFLRRQLILLTCLLLGTALAFGQSSKIAPDLLSLIETYSGPVNVVVQYNAVPSSGGLPGLVTVFSADSRRNHQPGASHPSVFLAVPA